MPDRVHQVRLAEPDSAVDEQRVVGARRRFGDGAARGVRELIRRADDEGVEGVAGIEAGGPGGGDGGGCGFERGGFVRAERNRRRVGRRSRRRSHREVRPLHLGHRFADDAGVVLGQPVLEERVRHPDRDAAPSSATKVVGLNQV